MLNEDKPSIYDVLMHSFSIVIIKQQKTMKKKWNEDDIMYEWSIKQDLFIILVIGNVYCIAME